LYASEYKSFALIGTASLGNILGSVYNWLLKFHLFKHTKKNWFPFKKKKITAAFKRFRKLGICFLLFAWVPIIGDRLIYSRNFKGNFFNIYIFGNS